MRLQIPRPLPQLLQRQSLITQNAVVAPVGCALGRLAASFRAPGKLVLARHHCRICYRPPRAGQRCAFGSSRRQSGRYRSPACCQAGENEENDLGAAFSEELSRRSDAAAQQLEQEEVCSQFRSNRSKSSYAAAPYLLHRCTPRQRALTAQHCSRSSGTGALPPLLHSDLAMPTSQSNRQSCTALQVGEIVRCYISSRGFSTSVSTLLLS